MTVWGWMPRARGPCVRIPHGDPIWVPTSASPERGYGRLGSRNGFFDVEAIRFREKIMRKKIRER